MMAVRSGLPSEEGLPPAPPRGAPPPRPPATPRDAEVTRRAPRAPAPPDPFADGEGLFPSLRDFFEKELQHQSPDDHHRRAVTLYQLGQLDEIAFHNPTAALGRYEAAFVLDTGLVPVHRALRRHYAAARRWPDYLRICDEELHATTDPAQRADHLTHMAEVQAARLADADGAVGKLQQAIALSPRSRRAMELLRGIYLRQEKWTDLMGVLRSLANITVDPSERARLMVEMASVCEFRLNGGAEAEELYTQALGLDPDNEAAAVSLRRLYLAHGRWQELVELLGREAGREHEADERFADLYRAARISELHLQDDDRAASLLETSTALRPNDPLPLQALTAVYQRTGRHEDLTAALARQLRLVRDPADRAALCFRLGQVYEDWLQQPAEAVKAYREALKEQPAHEAALRSLAALLTQFERWSELLDLYLLKAERAKDIARRADGYVRAAALCEQQLNDLPRAVDLYDRAYRMLPGLPEAFRALHRIYTGAGQWESLAELLETEARTTKDAGLGVSLLRQAGRIYEERLRSRERAIATLEKLQQVSPTDREVLVDLARLYEESGRSEDLRRTLERWAFLTEDSRERTELRRRTAELLEGPLRRPEQAVDLYRAILGDEPSDRPTLERLKTLFERTGRWNDLVAVLRAEIAVTPLGPDQAPLFVQIAHLAQSKLGDIDAARTAFDEALKVDSHFTPALIGLQDLLRQADLWDRLADLYGSNAERVREPVRAAAILCTAGELCEERLFDRAKAERFYNRALELDARNGPARQGLERLYLLAMDRGALEAHYLREAEGTTNPSLRARAYLRLGALFEGPANDADGAMAAYESALQVLEDQPDALRSLATVLRRLGRWERLAALLARIAGSARDRDAAIAALKEWASIVETHLSDKWDPAPIYERILEGDPKDAQALFALDSFAHAREEPEQLVTLAVQQMQAASDDTLVAALAAHAGLLLASWGRSAEAVDILRSSRTRQPDYLPVIHLLRRLDEQVGEWGEAAELLLKEGDLATTPEAAESALVRAGNILLDRFGDQARARAAFERVFFRDPRHAAAFGRLAGLLAAAEEWSSLVKLYQRRMEILDPPTRVPLQLELAALYRDHLGDVSAAIDVLRELLEVEPQHRKALATMADLCLSQRRWRDAEMYLARLTDAAFDDAELRRNALLRRSEILEEKLGDEEGSLEVLHRLIDEFPEDREALNRCMTYYQHRGNWEKTVEVLDELSRTGSPGERINNLVNLAEIYSRSLNDQAQAGSALRRAAVLCVDSGAGVDRIAEYFERRGDFEGLVTFLGSALEQLPPEGAPGAVAVRLARAKVLAGRLLRPSDAESEIRKALVNEPNSVPARLELAALHLWSDNLGEAIAEYTSVLDIDPFSLDAFRGLSRVYDRRGDLERAAGVAQAVCAVAGKDVPERKIAAQASAPMEAMLSSAVATPLGVHDFWQLLAHPDEPPLARELLREVADFLPQIFPDDVERTLTGTLLPVSEDDALARRCSQLGQVLGVDRFETCIGQNLSASMVALPGVPPKLVIDDAFAGAASPAEFRFAAGRGLAAILSRSLYLSVLPPRSIELLLAAVVELFERGYSGYLGQRREVEELSKSVNRAIPRRVRKALEEPARSYATAQPAAAAAWYVASQRSEERAGLLLAGDVEAALAVLTAEKASRAVQAEILRFSVGPHLYEARRRLGLSI